MTLEEPHVGEIGGSGNDVDGKLVSQALGGIGNRGQKLVEQGSFHLAGSRSAGLPDEHITKEPADSGYQCGDDAQQIHPPGRVDIGVNGGAHDELASDAAAKLSNQRA